MFLILGGFTIIGVSISHIGDDSDKAEMSISHLGTIAGNPHLVAIAIASSLILVAVVMFRKMYAGFSGRGAMATRIAPRWSSRITETGRHIAGLMKENREKKNEPD